MKKLSILLVVFLVSGLLSAAECDATPTQFGTATLRCAKLLRSVMPFPMISDQIQLWIETSDPDTLAFLVTVKINGHSAQRLIERTAMPTNIGIIHVRDAAGAVISDPEVRELQAKK
jgi:hypothetical protein